jgi:lipoprotein NlpI
MRFSAIPVRLTTSLALATLLAMRPAVADDAAACEKAKGDDAISACTRVINSGVSGAPIAKAYNGRGNAYQAKGDNDRAIQDYDQAIALDSKNAIVFYDRGRAYQAKGDDDRAIADYSETLRLDPRHTYPYAFIGRASAYQSKGDNDRAISDYSAVIKLNPKFTDAYFNRGRLYLNGGSVAKAQADFKQASELSPKDAYVALWLDLTERRDHAPGHLAEAAKQLDMTAWPAPIVRLFLGQMTPAAVLEAAQKTDAKTAKGQVCEANFYSGEFALLQGTNDEAIRLFRLAAKDCPASFDENLGAHAELRVLGAAP